MDTTLLKRDETNELDSKTVVVVVKDGSGGQREVKLSGKQRAALEWLMDDWNLTKAAEFAGVCRQTVSEWVNRDEDFMAVISAWRNEVRTVNQLKLVGADRGGGGDGGGEDSREGDVRTAMALLRIWGCLSGGVIVIRSCRRRWGRGGGMQNDECRVKIGYWQSPVANWRRVVV